MKMQLPTLPQRTFLPQDLLINSWQDLAPFFEDLKGRNIDHLESLKQWLKDKSEVEAVLEENQAWRYIKMSIDTESEAKRKAFEFFVQEIEPKLAPFSNEFEQKFLNSPALSKLDEKEFKISIKKAKKNIEVYREKNIQLISDLQTEAQQFGAISGKMQIDVNGEEVTMPKAASFLKETNRAFRKEIFDKIAEQRLSNAEALDNLFNSLIKKRHQLAINAGFKNYRDYMFAVMQRFDYTPQDCFDFHDAVENELVPLLNQFSARRKTDLGLEALKPYDLAVDSKGNSPLKPFEKAEDLISKTIGCFNNLDPYFGECIDVMNKMGHLDLESKKGKAPGGYNYPLYEIGVPFIFMNAVGTVRDLVTMVHEGGHAIHSFLSRDLEFTDNKSVTSEVAELASMSMELMSMDQWQEFFSNPEDLKRAKLEHLEDVLSTLPWIALIDKFQHWIYENPEHSTVERHDKWLELSARFSTTLVDYSGYEEFQKIAWQKQLHLFEVPFYYIEYGMAQLGAIAIYRNFKNDSTKAIYDYKKALSLGYSQSIREVYQAAGIEFNFTKSYINELATFIKKQISSIE